MSSFLDQQGEILRLTQALRDQLMAMLSDDDLTYKLPGQNPTLGALCREMGDIEFAYIEALKTFKQDFSYHNPDPAMETSVEKLAAWYKALDDEYFALLSGFSDEEMQTKLVDRGFTQFPLGVQFHIYREGLLIFYAKVSVYLKAMEKPLPEQWVQWVG